MAEPAAPAATIAQAQTNMNERRALDRSQPLASADDDDDDTMTKTEDEREDRFNAIVRAVNACVPQIVPSDIVGSSAAAGHYRWGVKLDQGFISNSRTDTHKAAACTIASRRFSRSSSVFVVAIIVREWLTSGERPSLVHDCLCSLCWLWCRSCSRCLLNCSCVFCSFNSLSPLSACLSVNPQARECKLLYESMCDCFGIEWILITSCYHLEVSISP